MGGSSTYLNNVIREFSKLPGIGHKSAARLAFHILGMKTGDVEALSRSITEMKRNIRICSSCGGISDREICSICDDRSRYSGLICVVESPRDIITIEGTGEFKGLYHVLNGLIAPLDGVGPDDLNIASLIDRCARDGFREVIIALNPTIEGDATSLYLSKILKPLDIRVTRIARGLPVGADLEYADSATIIKSIEGRVEM